MLIKNARLLLPEGERQGDLLIAEGKIAAIGEELDGSVSADTPILDATDLYLSAGFIDLQCNGGFGHDFTHDPSTIHTVAKQLPQFGITSFLPTIITSPLEVVAKAQTAITKTNNEHGANPLGLHIEGPFLHPDKKGAHNEGYLQPPNLSAVANWSRQTGICLVTLAPELEGAIELIKCLTNKGIIVSAGHSTATYEQAQKGFSAGVGYATHLFDGMPPLHHRHPNLVGAILDDERITVGIIPDGIHVHPSMVNMVWRTMGNRLNLVTDCMAAMGQGDGNFWLGDQHVQVKNGVATLASGTLAGSVITLDQGVRNLLMWTDCSVSEAISSVTTVPANLLGLSKKGRLTLGADADLVLLSTKLDVIATWVTGEMLYDSR